MSIKGISKGTKTLATAMAVRWGLGWGFSEALIPIFIYSFSSSFAEAGLLKASYEISLVLMFPIAGIFADRIKPTLLILVGLVIYLFVGASYFLAGITGLAIFIVIARLLNGISFSLDSVGRETYLRRNNPPGKLATVFGYFDSILNLWWIAAALSAIFLVKFLAIHWLLFIIIPASAASFIIIWTRLRKNDTAPKGTIERSGYKDLVKELGTWNYRLRMMMVLNLILSASWSIIIFFLPIEMYSEGASYTTVILFGVAASLPILLGIWLGRIFDKKGPRTFIYGLLLYSIFLIMIGMGGSYALFITLAFLIGIVQEFIYVGKEELVTTYSDPDHFGRVNGFMRSVMNLGALIGPLVAGIIMDATGSMSVIYMALALCTMVLAVTFAFYGRLKHKRKMSR